MEKHCYFVNEEFRLLGVLHIPEKEQERQSIGLVFLHGWAGYRIGPHQMFTKMARRAEKLGFCSLRFDFRGRGDSEGDTEAATLSTMISDALAACAFLRESTDVAEIALIGDCSGSEVAIGAGPLDPTIRAMILWSAPIVAGDRRSLEAAKRKHILITYLRKLLYRETWQKLFGRRLQLGQIWRVLRSGGKGAGETGSPEDAAIDWERRFMDFAGPRLFIYGGNDPTTPECVEHYRALCERAGKPYEIHIVPGANHAFYSLAWENEVIEKSLAWLQEQFVISPSSQH